MFDIEGLSYLCEDLELRGRARIYIFGEFEYGGMRGIKELWNVLCS